MTDQTPFDPEERPAPPPVPSAPLGDAEAGQWAALAHLLGGIFSWLPPLIIWLVYKDRSRYVDAEAKKALNFQILVFIGYLIGALLYAIIIGYLINVAVFVISLVFGIKNYQAVNAGQQTSYPIALQLIK